MAKIIGRVGIKVVPEVANKRGDMRRDMDRQLDAMDDDVRKRKPTKIKVEVDEKGLERDFDRAVNELDRKGRTLHLDVELDRKGLTAELAKVERDLGRLTRDQKIDVDFDGDALSKMHREIRDMHRAIEADAIGVRLDVDMPNAALLQRRLRKLTEEVRQNFGDQLTLKVDYDSQTSLKAARAAIEKKLSDLKAASVKVRVSEKDLLEARHKIDSFINDESDKKIEIPVGLGLVALAAARLSWLTRPRTVSIFAKVNAKSVAVAAGILSSLAGLNVLERVGTSLENVVRNFDKFAVKGATVTGVIGNIVNALGYLTTNLFSIGDGILESVGIFAMAPSLLAGTTAAVLVLTSGFKNFKKAIDGDAEALAALPPIARKAATALTGTWTSIQRPVQKAFWDGLGDSLQDTILTALPVIRRGLTETAEHMGRFGSDVLGEFKKIAKNGDMRAMFSNLSKGFDEASGAAAPLTEAINTLGLRGTYYFPRLGKWISSLSKDFNKWVQDAEQAGDIDRWIEDGIQSFKDMGRVINGVSRQFKGITVAISNAGGQDLSGFADEMQHWGDIMNREPFRSRMTNIFEGARTGASKLNVGVKNLGRAFGESSEFVQGLLDKLGELGGSTLTRLAELFSQGGFQTGILRGIDEISDAMDNLGPTAKAAGNVVGTAFDVGGTVIRNLVPLITTISRILDNMLRTAAPGLEALSGPLSRLLNNAALLAEGPLMAIADVIAAIGPAVGNAPKLVQNLVAAFAAFALLRGRLGSSLLAITTGIANLGQKLQGTNLRYGVQNGIIVPLKELPVGINRVAGDTQRATGRLGNAAKGIGSKLGGIARSIGGFMALGGGVVGSLGIMAIFTAIAVGIGMVGEKAAENESKISDFQGSLDDLGNTTQASSKLNAKWMSETTTAWGQGSASILQILDDIGVGSDTAIKKLGGTAQDYASLMDSVQQALNKVKAEGEAYLQSQLDKGITDLSNDETWKSYQRQADGIAKVKSELEGYQRVIDIARQRQQDIARATGVTTGAVSRFSGSMGTLADEMATTADRASALNSALDVLSGGAVSKQDAAIALADAIRGIGEAMKDSATGKPIKVKDLIDNTGKIDVSIDADPSGVKAKLANALKTGTQAALTDAFAQADTAPPARRTKVFASAYEKALSGIRAEIDPVLTGNKSQKDAQFKSWLKNMGWDKPTVEALIDGKVDEAELAKLPKQIRDFLNAWLANDPVEAKVEGDTAPLETKVTAANQLLKTLGASRTIPTIGADGKPLDAATQKAVGLLKQIGGSTTLAEIDANASKLTAKQKKALRELSGIDKYEAIPTIDANGKPLSNEVRASIAKLLGLSKKKPTPKLDANGKPLSDKVKQAEAKGAALGRKTYSPKLDARNKAANAKIQQTQNAGRIIGRQVWTPRVSISVSGLGAVAQARSLMNSLKSRTVSLRVQTQYSQTGQVPRGGLKAWNADGSITYGPGRFHKKFAPQVQSFANGGFSSKPTSAHIARAGSYVTYAEKETGGEAFIPLAASKRTRSVGILDQVARMFGLSLIGAQMADGGVSGGTTTGSSGALVSIGTMIAADTDEAIRKIQNSQRDALAMEHMNEVL